MSFVKHLRLGKDVEVKSGNGGSEFVAGTGAYDVYRGKDNTETVWVSFTANGHQAEFLKKFGKKGSVLKFTGEIMPGRPYQKEVEVNGKKEKQMVSTINLTVDSVKFSEVRLSQGNAQGGNGGNPAPAQKSTPSKSAVEAEVEQTEDIFDEFWNDEETA